MFASSIRLGAVEGGLAKEEPVGPYAVIRKGLCLSHEALCCTNQGSMLHILVSVLCIVYMYLTRARGS